MKQFEIGQNRFVVVKNSKDNPTVTIMDKGTSNAAEFPFSRWSCLTLVYLPLIDDAVKQLESDQDVHFQQHIGGTWYVSVTKEYSCVDLRQFYRHPLVGPRPTKTGIALRLHEWKKLVEILPEIQKKYPDIEKTPLCWDLQDHRNPEVDKNCMECNPFQLETG